jgi:CRISPR system Cascade subunit CasB
MEEQKPHPFVDYLETLRERDDRGALADLRRGLGEPPGTAPSMYRYVVPFLPKDPPSWVERAYFMVAALFAYHPKPGGRGNMGKHFAAARDPQGDDAALERRFTALLAAHQDDLDFYLRQAVSFLRSKEIPIDWHRLIRDIQNWGHPEGYVQKAWARAFWSHRAAPESVTES